MKVPASTAMNVQTNIPLDSARILTQFYHPQLLGVYTVTMERLTPPEEAFLPNDTDHEHSNEMDIFYGTFYVQVLIDVTMTFNIFSYTNETQVTY